VEIKKGKIIYNGTTKKVYPTEDDGLLILHFKDEVKGKNAQQSKVKNKGNVNAKMSRTLFPFLESYHVNTHFVNGMQDNEILVKDAEVIPVQVVVWNIADRDFAKRYKIKKGFMLEYPVVELYLKNKELKNPMISADYASAFGHATHDEMKEIDSISRKINAVLKSFFSRRRLLLGSIVLEFGRQKDGERRIILTDEISADSTLLYDADKGMEFFSQYNSLAEAYKVLDERI